MSSEGPNIVGERGRYIDNGTAGPSYWVYRVKLKGGPFDGRETFAGNTREVFMGGVSYVLEEDGFFHFAG